jgi:hypothetical protein
MRAAALTAARFNANRDMEGESMKQPQFIAESKPMMDAVDAMFGKLFAPEECLIVTHEGIEWCVTGRYEQEETPCGMVSFYRIKSVWLACDPERNDMKDYLKFIVLSNLADLAVEKYEAKEAIYRREQALREEAMAERE